MKYPQRGSLLFLILALSLLGAARADEAKHEALLGKPAPDFKAEYAVNGTFKGLADLKGKVVLLVFGHLSKSPTWNVLSTADGWYARHKSDGFEVFVIPVYDYKAAEQWRWSRFEPTSGKAFKAKNATREQEEMALKAFATDRQLTYPLLRLAPEEASKIFGDTYGVTSVPQSVLIDRKGIVRLIRVGDGDEKLRSLEMTIDKLAK
ncbi:MAG TPA: redoxin domain-containing protein [Gemmataceae bacterium]|nr:redoxin domain-containing protein [Gemmataceae bacterium]